MSQSQVMSYFQGDRNRAARRKSRWNLAIIKPYREDVAVAVECIFTWYWLADLCHAEKIPFVLGHALYMKAIHGGKTKNDKIDSEKIARLLKGGMLPEAYAYPSEMRGIRDLLRRRLFFVRKRAEIMARVQMTHQQYNITLAPFTTSNKILYQSIYLIKNYNLR